MQRRLFYTSPVDFEHLDGWKALAKRLRQAATRSVRSDANIEIVETPRFAPTTAVGSENTEPTHADTPSWAPNDDTHETLLGLADETIGSRTIRIEPWSTYPGHSVVGIALGTAILRKERRDLLRNLPKTTKHQCSLLYDHESTDSDDRYDADAARVAAYRLDLDDDRGRSTLEEILSPFDEPFYLCERWLLQDDSGRIDEDRYTIHRELGPHLVFCTPNLDTDSETRDAARIHLWSMATRGAGLLALFPDDPNLETLARTFLTTSNHLQAMLAPPSGLLRVAIARSHPQMVVCYDSFWESFGGDQPVFIV